MSRLKAKDATYPVMRHNFKWARITKIDYSLDICDITILDKDKNEIDEKYNNVPIFYHCEPNAKQNANGSLENASYAFELGDDVLVRFEDNRPIVVARLDGLKPCLRGFLFLHSLEYDKVIFSKVKGEFIEGESTTCSDGGKGTVAKYEPDKKLLYHDAIKCWSGTITGNSSGAVGTIGSCEHPRYIWHPEELPSYNAYTKKTEVRFPVEELCAHGCGGSAWCGRSWSKTYESITLTAFLWNNGVTLVWSVAATRGNKQLLFKHGNTEYIYYHPNGSPRYKWETDTEIRVCHIGFDIWEENGYIMVGIANDDGGVFVFKLNGKYLEMQDAPFSNFRSWWIENRCKLTPKWRCDDVAERHFRLIGYDGPGYKLYWCWFGLNTYYEENLKTGEITERKLGNWPTDDDGMILDAIWHPLERKAYWYYKTGQKREDKGIKVYRDESAYGHVGHGFMISYSWTEGGGFVPVNPFPCECLLGPETISIPTPWGFSLTAYLIGIYSPQVCGNYYGSTTKDYYAGRETIMYYGKCGIGNSQYDLGKDTIYDSCILLKAYGSTGTYDKCPGDDCEAVVCTKCPELGEPKTCYIVKTGSYSAHVSKSECVETSHVEYHLSYWQFNQTGGISVVGTRVPFKVVQGEDIRYCTADEGTEFVIGSKTIAETNAGSVFPWDDGWQAILLKGTTEHGTVKNHVAYKVKDKNEFLVEPSGKRFTGVVAFYQKLTPT